MHLNTFFKCFNMPKIKRLKMQLDILTWLCLLSLLHKSDCQGLLAYNLCEDETNEGTQYYACMSDSLHLLEGANSNFEIIVDPRDATCGEPSTNIYAYNNNCTHASLGPLQQCEVCDNTRQAFSHPPEYMTDNNDATFWLSRTWLDYTASNPVLPINITLKFNHAYELRDDIVITFWSSRPRSMILYKSTDDGATWDVLQYYYMNCGESEVDPASQITQQTPDAVICTEDYSRDLPYNYGRIVFPVTDDRYQLFLGDAFTDFEELYQAFSSTNLDEFLTVTDIKISLLHPMTDANEGLGHEIDLIKYYYGISEISVSASCYCNLHGRFCTVLDNITVCECRHFTTGPSCETCLPMYNNRPWSRGSFLPYPTGTANQCQRCECNQHADSCTYNDVSGHGVCDNCTHNTQGDFCQQCLEGYYINGSMPLSHTNVCIDCDCESLGLTNASATCNYETGQCPCKELIANNNRRCDHCTTGYYGLLLADNQPGVCKECGCNTDGTQLASTACDHNTGDCQCKETITGRACNQCSDGFYSFPTSPALHCLMCNCNPGGSISPSCDPVTGRCECRVNITGLKCDVTQSNYYAPYIDSVSLQPDSGGSCDFEADVITEENPFTGDLYAVCIESQSVVFDPIAGGLNQPDVSWSYTPVVRYSRNASLPAWSSMSLELEATGNSGVDISGYRDSVGLDPACPANGVINTFTLLNMSSEIGGAYSVEGTANLDMRCRYVLTLSDGSAAIDIDTIVIDSIVLFPDVTRSTAYAQTDNATRQTYDHCMLNVSRLISRDATLATEECRDFFWAVMVGLAGRALPCTCDGVGSLSQTCSPHGGQCACKRGAYGLSCDHCQPGYFNFTQAGCQPCECDTIGSGSMVCDQDSGQCDCLNSVARFGNVNTDGVSGDRKCSSCLQNYYGFSTGLGCSECLCNTEGRLSSQCDVTTGQCQCKATIAGLQCDRCLAGYYLFSADGCSVCNCTVEGATSIECHQATGDCTCKTHVLDTKCGTCSADSFNLRADNPDGCQPCFCYGHGTQCTSAEGYQAAMISANLEQIREWTQTNPTGAPELTHFRAAERFLGNQLYSYMQYITIEYQAHNLGTNFTGHMPVVVEGNGTTLYYSADEFNILPDEGAMIQALLHERLWKRIDNNLPISYFNFYAVLADLTGLYIQRRFNAVSVDITSLLVRSAQLSPDGAGLVTNVEQCVCTATRNVLGISCESCSTGNQRITLPGDAYDVCQSCDCNNNGETDPPVCSESTGHCLNCRNGTVGFNCESCAVNVLSPACEVCEDEYWGLSRDGCQPCDCDAVGATSTICNKVTGECACAPNIEGRRCDQCADNYFDLQSSGCEVCDECYELVGVQVNTLRDLRTNLTDTLRSLRANDDTSVLGNFTQRKQQTIESMQQLTEFLERAQEVQGPVTEKVEQLNSTLNTLKALLSNDAITLLDSSNETTEQAGSILEQSRDVKSVTNITVREAYSLIEDVIRPSTQRLEDLVLYIQDLERTIATSSNGSLGQARILGQTVLEIEQNSSDANTLAADSLQTVQQNLATHASTNNKVAEITAFYNLVSTQGSDRLTDVRALTNVTSGIVTDVNNARSTIEELQLLDNEQLNDLERNMENLSDRAQATINEATPENVVQLQTINIPVVQQETADMVAESQQTKSIVDDYLTRMTVAHSTVTGAQALVDSTFTAAQTMLQITSDFDNRALAVEENANASLSSVESIISISEAAIASSQRVSGELGECITESNTARLTAQQASNTAQLNLQSVAHIPARFAALESRCETGLNDLESKASSIVFNNITKLGPAHDRCSADQNQITEIERLSQIASGNLTAVSTQINTTRDNLNDVITAAQDVAQINTSDVTILRQEIDATQQDFTNRDLATRVTQLKSAIEEKKAWLESMRTRKLQLQQQLNRLRTIQSQIQP